jgi:hypothetical protein
MAVALVVAEPPAMMTRVTSPRHLYAALEVNEDRGNVVFRPVADTGLDQPSRSDFAHLSDGNRGVFGKFGRQEGRSDPISPVSPRLYVLGEPLQPGKAEAADAPTPLERRW